MYRHCAKMSDCTPELIVGCLRSILSGRSEERQKAEEEIRVLEVGDNYGVILAEVAHTPHIELPLRQLASVVLKQYVEGHWSQESSKFCEPQVTVESRRVIKHLLLASLGSEESKIRAAAAYAVSAIAVWEWPEEWPELFDVLMTGVHSGNPCLVNGSMQVLEEFCAELTDQHLPHIAPILFPELLKITSEEQVYDIETRMRAVTIFESMTSLVLTVADTYPDVQHFLLPWTKQYLAVFSAILASYDKISSAAEFGLVREILSVLTKLLSAFPQHMAQEVQVALQPAWTILVTSCQLYVSSCVNSIQDTHGLEGALYSLFDFISALLEVRGLQRILLPTLTELIYHLLSYMMVSEAQLLSWEDEPEKILEDENDELYSNSIRMSALDLVHSMSGAASLALPCLQGLIAAINKHLEQALVAKQQGQSHWWKIHEACMLVLPLVGQGVVNGSVEFDVLALMNNIVLPDMSYNAHPLLTGRCLWLSGKLVTLLPTDVLTQCLAACVSGLAETQPMLVRICAVMATHSFCCGLQDSPSTLEGEVAPFAQGLLRGTVELVKLDNDAIRIQVLEALTVIISVAKETVGQESRHIVELCTQLFVKCCHDPGVLSVLEEVFHSLSCQPSCQESLLHHFTPTLVRILQSSEDHLPTGITSAVLDVWQQVLRGLPSPLPHVVIDPVFPLIVRNILQAEDSAILQSGGECVKVYLHRGVMQLSEWSTSDGQSGLLLATQVVVHLLNPSLAEFSASFVGRLVVMLIKQVGGLLGDHLESIVRSLLSKLHSVATFTVVQSLLMVLVYLMHTQLEATLSFLEQIPDVSGQSSMVFVLQEWTSRHPSFFGKWETRMSSLAMADLLSHYLATGDKRLVAIETVGEEVVKPSEGIMTRSMRKKAPVEYTKVVLPQKMLKLLISDYEVALETDAGQRGVVTEGEEEWEDDEDINDIDMFSALLAGEFSTLQEEEGEEEQEFADDPILQLDMKVHLEEVLRGFCQSHRFKELLLALNSKEVELLSHLHQ